MALLSDVGDVISYWDETGHSKDRKQRFNGIAGLIAPANEWERLEAKWIRTLREFRISCFHAKEVAAFQGEFRKWSEIKRQKLLGKLLRHIAEIKPLPFGSILCMDDFREVADQYPSAQPDPYHIAFGGVLGFVTGFLERFGHPKQRAAVVFSDQVEFRHQALLYYEDICASEPLLKKRTKPPTFDDMRELVPLQAADLVAYELYKEHERLRGFRTHPKPRHPYQEILKLSDRLGLAESVFVFHTKADLLDSVKRSIATERTRLYWERRSATKKQVAKG